MKYIEIYEEPVQEEYVKLIEYSCNNNTIMSFKIEIDKLETVRRNIRKKSAQIIFSLPNISETYIRDNWNKQECINMIYNELKDKKGMPWNKKIAKWEKSVRKGIITNKELEQIRESTIRMTISIMLYVAIGNDMYNKKMNEYINMLKNNIIEIDKRKYKPGWRNYDRYYLKIDNFLKEKLLEANRLFQWDFPDLPVDLCFFRNGKIWLESIAHEEMCTIYTSDKEEIDYLRKIGLKFDVIIKEGIEGSISVESLPNSIKDNFL